MHSRDALSVKYVTRKRRDFVAQLFIFVLNLADWTCNFYSYFFIKRLEYSALYYGLRYLQLNRPLIRQRIAHSASTEKDWSRYPILKTLPCEPYSILISTWRVPWRGPLERSVPESKSYISGTGRYEITITACTRIHLEPDQTQNLINLTTYG